MGRDRAGVRVGIDKGSGAEDHKACLGESEMSEVVKILKEVGIGRQIGVGGQMVENFWKLWGWKKHGLSRTLGKLISHKLGVKGKRLLGRRPKQKGAMRFVS